MDSDISDERLLRDFVQHRSDSAFRTLTERHLDLVFGTALRASGDHTAAEEITQNVFIALAKKAHWLQREGSLASWLHRAALLEARQWWRAQTRRRVREQTAVELETLMKTSPAEAPALAGMLDDALLELNHGERQAVLLRHFEGLNHREIGTALGIGEDAARKRVDKGMEQLAAFFRKRGFGVGSATALTVSIKSVAHAAPPGLAASAAQAAISAGSTVSPWLAKLLAVGKLQVAGLCVLLLLVPAVWQEARLNSAQGEQRRLMALLALLESEHAGISSGLAEVKSQIRGLVREIDTVQSNSTAMSAAIDGGELDPRLFLWSEQVDYVRVSKSVVDRIAFDGSTLDKVHGRISPQVLGALGLNSAEQARAQEVFNRHFMAYRDWADENSQLAKISELADPLPNFLTNGSWPDVITDDTRVWTTPRLSNDAAWRQAFQQELRTVTGEERAGVILRMANDDHSLLECLQQFGGKRSHLVVTPNTKGGFRLIQVAEPGYSQSTQGTFSEVLNPVPEGKFDEEAVRREVAENIRLARLEHPEIRDEDVPPMEALIEDERKTWVIQQEEKRGWIRRQLGRSLPQPLVEYLRDWLAAHPGTPDSM